MKMPGRGDTDSRATNGTKQGKSTRKATTMPKKATKKATRPARKRAAGKTTRKAAKTRKDNLRSLKLLRTVFGHMAPADLTPAMGYAYRDRRLPARVNPLTRSAK